MKGGGLLLGAANPGDLGPFGLYGGDEVEQDPDRDEIRAAVPRNYR
jgi:hypothetical protein